MATNTKKRPAPVEDVADVEVEGSDAPILFTAKDLANELKIDQKSFRRWLRSYTKTRANKGGRWSFTTEARDELLAAYAKRNEGTSPELPEADDEG